MFLVAVEGESSIDSSRTSIERIGDLEGNLLLKGMTRLLMVTKNCLFTKKNIWGSLVFDNYKQLEGNYHHEPYQ